jgi:dCMP deaminase
MKQKFVKLYMDLAERIAQLSYAQRLQVGAVIVKDDNVTFGYNGMPSDWDNNCEDKVYDPEGINEDEKGRYNLKTKQEVLHAEANAIAKFARTTLSAEGSTIFCTHSPCIDCAKLIYQSGIKHVYYKNDYRSEDGIKFLKMAGITVAKQDN